MASPGYTEAATPCESLENEEFDEDLPIFSGEVTLRSGEEILVHIEGRPIKISVQVPSSKMMRLLVSGHGNGLYSREETPDTRLELMRTPGTGQPLAYFPFLELPRELRDEIYAELYEETFPYDPDGPFFFAEYDATVLANEISTLGSINRAWHKRNSWPTSGLIFASNMILIEATPLWW